jgi:Spy/CpxP family protein refolding chaperone
MMNMFRRVAMRAGAVALCSAALCATPMMAQGGGGGGRMQMTSDQRVSAVDKAVTLTDDQKIKIKAIYEADMKKMADMRASGEDFTTLMPKIQAMRADENAQIKALLTDEQKPKFDAYLASQPQRGPRPGGAPGGPGGAPGGGPGGAGAPPPPPPPAPAQ